MTISIITVCFNSESTIESTIESVINQQCDNLEYVIIDGGSTDNTINIINKYKSNIDVFISENDSGIYDALNKGISKANGDVIGILHADDVFKNNEVISKVLNSFITDVDIVYGDIEYVSKYNNSKVIRYWRAGEYGDNSFKLGWMPPHTSFFLLRTCYEKYGKYSLELGTSADYELMLRMFEVYHLSAKYLPEILVSMKLGGASNASFNNRWKANRNDKKSWKINGIKPYWFTFFMKPLRKIPQFLKFRPYNS